MRYSSYIDIDTDIDLGKNMPCLFHLVRVIVAEFAKYFHALFSHYFNSLVFCFVLFSDGQKSS